MSDFSIGQDLSSRFPSEELLRQAVAGLLTRMEKVTGVQILHGSQEYGKDIVFEMPGLGNERIPCACVVKNSPISGSASSSEGARTIVTQVEQAFDTPLVHSANGRNVYLERVYIVSPFPMSAIATNSIAAKLRDRAGRIVFLDGARLFDLFKTYWPDYLAHESLAIEHYLRRVTEALAENAALTGVSAQYRLGPSDEQLTRIYVEPRFGRDLRQYTVASAILGSLPPKDRLRQSWSKAEIVDAQKKLKWLPAAFAALEQWGYLSNEAGLTATESLSRLESRLLATWELTAEHVAADTKNTVTELRFSERKQLNECLRTAESAVGHIVNTINAILVTLNTYLETLALSTPISVLGEEQYLQWSRLASFAYSDGSEILFATKWGRQISFPSDLLNVWPHAVLIVAPAGYGKTTFCRWHALRDAERFTTGESDVLPVYVPLHLHSRAKLGDFEQTFLRDLGRSALLPQAAREAYQRAGRVRVYLDGLDEIPYFERRKEVVELARSGSGPGSRFQVIITARDYIHGEWLTWIPRVQLVEFDDAQVTEFARKWLEAKEQDPKQFFRQLGAVPALKMLMRTPLLATLTILVFCQTGKLPENRNRLYEIFVDLLSGGWDLAKGITRGSRFGGRLKIAVLMAIAIEVHGRGRREFSAQSVEEAVARVLQGNRRQDWRAILDELIFDRLIVQSGSTLSFSHLSFQEYLAAKELLTDPDSQRRNKVLAEVLKGSEWWLEVIRFYIEMSGKPRDLRYWLEGVGREIKGRDEGQYRSLLEYVDNLYPVVTLE